MVEDGGRRNFKAGLEKDGKIRVKEEDEFLSLKIVF